MKKNLQQNKKRAIFFALIIAVVVMIAVTAALIFSARANEPGAENAAYQALLRGDNVRLVLYARFMKDKDMVIEGSSLLMRAVENKNVKAAEILIKAGADGDKKNGDSTAFLQTLRTKQFALAETFLKKGDINVNTKVNEKSYLVWMIDEDNAQGCTLLLNQPLIDTKESVEGKSLGTYLYTRPQVQLQAALAFREKLRSDEGIAHYLEGDYQLRYFGGAYGIATGSDVVPYILICSAQENNQNVYYIFNAERFSRYIDTSLSFQSKYVCYASPYGQEELVYVSGLSEAEKIGEKKMKDLAEAVKEYLNEHAQRLAGTNCGNISSVSTLLQLVNSAPYSIDDCFALDDEAYGLLVRDYVQLSTNVSVEALKDVSVVEYANEKDIAEAKKAALFTLRMYPLAVSKDIEHIYLVKSGSMKAGGMDINGAFTNKSDLILTKAGSYTLMVTTYVHEFAHFITRDNERDGLKAITKEYSTYGYYTDYTGAKFYGIDCVDTNGKKKDFLTVYEDLNDMNAFRKDGFVRPYASYNSWEDFASTAESMYSFIAKTFFQTYASQNGYQIIEKKFDYVKSVYNDYANAKKTDRFMTEAYFESVQYYLSHFNYDMPTIR